MRKILTYEIYQDSLNGIYHVGKFYDDEFFPLCLFYSTEYNAPIWMVRGEPLSSSSSIDNYNLRSARRLYRKILINQMKEVAERLENIKDSDEHASLPSVPLTKHGI